MPIAPALAPQQAQDKKEEEVNNSSAQEYLSHAYGGKEDRSPIYLQKPVHFHSVIFGKPPGMEKP